MEKLKVLKLNRDISPRFNDVCFHAETNKDKSVKLKTPHLLYTHEQFFYYQRNTLTALVQVDDGINFLIYLN